MPGMVTHVLDYEMFSFNLKGAAIQVNAASEEDGKNLVAWIAERGLFDRYGH